MEASPSFHHHHIRSTPPSATRSSQSCFHDESSPGPFMLAFRDIRAWQSGYKSCHSKIVRQCEEGARFGCAVSASNKCKSPWWWALIGRKSRFDSTERARCEELEMDAFLAAAKERCVGFADEKCLKAFRDARIAISERKTVEKKARKWVHWASMSNFGFLPNLIELDRNSSQNDKGLENLLSEGSEFFHGRCKGQTGITMAERMKFRDWYLKIGIVSALIGASHGNVHDQNWLLCEESPFPFPLPFPWMNSNKVGDLGPFVFEFFMSFDEDLLFLFAPTLSLCNKDFNGSNSMIMSRSNSMEGLSS